MHRRGEVVEVVRLWIFQTDETKILLLQGDVIDRSLDGNECHVALHHPWNGILKKDKIWITRTAHTLLEFSSPQHPSKGILEHG